MSDLEREMVLSYLRAAWRHHRRPSAARVARDCRIGSAGWAELKAMVGERRVYGPPLEANHQQ